MVQIPRGEPSRFRLSLCSSWVLRASDTVIEIWRSARPGAAHSDDCRVANPITSDGGYGPKRDRQIGCRRRTVCRLRSCPTAWLIWPLVDVPASPFAT